jgi:hypothetical protein
LTATGSAVGETPKYRCPGPPRASGAVWDSRPGAGRPDVDRDGRANRCGASVAASAVVGADITAEEAFRWGWLAQAAASALWDDDAWRALLVRQVRFAREAGALDELPVILGALGTAVAWSGDFAAAAALIAEADAICEVTGSPAAPFTAMMLASLRGRHAEAVLLIEATIAGAEAGGQGIAVAYAHWAAAILHNGLGQYHEALTAAGKASEDTYTLHIAMWALPEPAGSAWAPPRSSSPAKCWIWCSIWH